MLNLFGLLRVSVSRATSASDARAWAEAVPASTLRVLSPATRVASLHSAARSESWAARRSRSTAATPGRLKSAAAKGTALHLDFFSGGGDGSSAARAGCFAAS